MGLSGFAPNLRRTLYGLIGSAHFYCSISSALTSAIQLRRYLKAFDSLLATRLIFSICSCCERKYFFLPLVGRLIDVCVRWTNRSARTPCKKNLVNYNADPLLFSERSDEMINAVGGSPDKLLTLAKNGRLTNDNTSTQLGFPRTLIHQGTVPLLLTVVAAILANSSPAHIRFTSPTS